MSMGEAAECLAIRTVRRMLSRQDVIVNRVGEQWQMPIVSVEARAKLGSIKRWR